MGLSIRIFIVEEDDTLKRLPMIRFDRLLKRDPNESLPKYAGNANLACSTLPAYGTGGRRLYIPNTVMAEINNRMIQQNCTIGYLVLQLICITSYISAPVNFLLNVEV